MSRRRIFGSHGGQSRNTLKNRDPFVFSHQKGGQSPCAIPSPSSVGRAGPLASALNQEALRAP
jgi:hypothetical protein